MPSEQMCSLHYVPGCGLCRKAEPVPPQVNSAVPVQVDSAPVSAPTQPTFSSPQAALALKLAECFESISRGQMQVDLLAKGLEEAKAELAKAVTERDKIQSELMPVRKVDLVMEEH